MPSDGTYSQLIYIHYLVCLFIYLRQKSHSVAQADLEYFQYHLKKVFLLDMVTFIYDLNTHEAGGPPQVPD